MVNKSNIVGGEIGRIKSKLFTITRQIPQPILDISSGKIWGEVHSQLYIELYKEINYQLLWGK